MTRIWFATLLITGISLLIQASTPSTSSSTSPPPTTTAASTPTIGSATTIKLPPASCHPDESTCQRSCSTNPTCAPYCNEQTRTTCWTSSTTCVQCLSKLELRDIARQYKYNEHKYVGEVVGTVVGMVVVVLLVALVGFFLFRHIAKRHKRMRALRKTTVDNIAPDDATQQKTTSLVTKPAPVATVHKSTSPVSSSKQKPIVLVATSAPRASHPKLPSPVVSPAYSHNKPVSMVSEFAPDATQHKAISLVSEFAPDATQHKAISLVSEFAPEATQHKAISLVTEYVPDKPIDTASKAKSSSRTRTAPSPMRSIEKPTSSHQQARTPSVSATPPPAPIQEDIYENIDIVPAV